MLRAEYDQYYDTLVKPTIDQFVTINNGSVDRRFILSAQHPKNEIYEEYQNQKTLFRLLYKKDVPKGEYTKIEEEDPLHRHKVCACMTAAIIKCRPLYVTDGFPDDDAFTLMNAPSANEQLAFSVGLSLLRAYILADDSETERHQYFEGTDFFVPPAFYKENEPEYNFDTQMIWSLYDANVINGLSIPLLADIYFLLDRYHEVRCKLNELRIKCEPIS